MTALGSRRRVVHRISHALDVELELDGLNPAIRDAAVEWSRRALMHASHVHDFSSYGLKHFFARDGGDAESVLYTSTRAFAAVMVIAGYPVDSRNGANFLLRVCARRPWQHSRVATIQRLPAHDRERFDELVDAAVRSHRQACA